MEQNNDSRSSDNAVQEPGSSLDIISKILLYGLLSIPLLGVLGAFLLVLALKCNVISIWPS
ncbi:hypothetical protein [Cerasicoccus maritimus]|uniref:hypothetical protein n=1 Tax=Cerasicoccus maritimus TaxID=490089 RepID=UPI0028525B92|nr:hypothetical protein [Cerasicoccus maritimus]